MAMMGKVRRLHYRQQKSVRDKFAVVVRDDMQRWGEVIRAAGIKAE